MLRRYEFRHRDGRVVMVRQWHNRSWRKAKRKALRLMEGPFTDFRVMLDGRWGPWMELERMRGDDL